jgi:deazaflavin-dependent oxidoreductase (nitroreductase family)
VSLPKRVARWNKVSVNRVARHVAPWLPGLALVVHHGRRSGRTYQTPVNVFGTCDGFIVALTYGPDSDWVRNVQAAGGCELRTRGRVLRVDSPRVYHDEARPGIRPVERQALRLMGVADFLSLKTVPAGDDGVRRHERPRLQQRGLAGVVDEQAVVAQPQAGGQAVLLETAVVHEVADREAAGDRGEVRDQTAVTAPPQALRAHDRQLPCPRLVQDGRDRRAELR